MKKMNATSIAPWMLAALFGLAGAGCATDDEFGYGEDAGVTDQPGVVEEERGLGDEPGFGDEEPDIGDEQ